jgi:eukaryotic-like serine/threonine-protein kinase
MAVQCPYCRHELSLKTAPPGMYTTTCSYCARKFYLAVPEDPQQQPVAAPIPAERENVAVSTVGAQSAPAPPDRVNKIESRATDRPVMTLSEPARSTATLPEPAPPATATGERGVAPAVASRAFAWSRLATGSVPRLVGGYLVLRELGRSALGPVYLARQLWLTRDVKLKVMKLLWARNAPFVARFTREAYAAAQLQHDNLAQLEDFGESRGTTYFCTEYIDGQNLGGLIGQKKRLGAEEAASYILQAARGLKHAHDQSMLHRDIKPENLWLDHQGLVKVADLGLVNTPELAEVNEAIRTGKAQPQGVGSGETGPGRGPNSMADEYVGTPGFMAPEQARDPARVDARADIYSLGCTLYFLVTGRPPFEGRSALEIVNKQETEPVKPPEQLAKGIPASLSAITLKMTAKRPDERFASLVDVIDALENFLGVAGAGSVAPREDQVNLLEASVNTFNLAPSARMRSWLFPAILALCGALAILCLLTGRVVGAGVFSSLGLWTAAADFVLVGSRRKTPLFVRVCAFMATWQLSEWLTAAAALAILVVLLVILQLFWVWLGLGLLAIGIAVAFHAAFDRQAEAERLAPLEQVREMLRAFRLQGHDEHAVRQFVCVYSGARWEEFYEALFGYDAMREAHQRWAGSDRTGARPGFAGWRGPIAAWFDAAIAARREADLVATFWKIEERNLQALGENLVSARRKARRSALALVATAADIKESIRASAGAVMVNRSIAWAMHEAAVKPEKVLLDHERGLLAEPEQERSNIAARAVTMLLGPKVRFLAGAALLAGCVAWMHQNAMISAEHAAALVEAAKTGDVEAIQTHAEAGVAHAREAAAQPTRPLDLPDVPPALLALVSSFGAGVGGLILIFSSLFGGIRITFFAIPAAAIPVLLPRLWHPALGAIDPSLVPSLVGVAILAAGVFFGRR